MTACASSKYKKKQINKEFSVQEVAPLTYVVTDETWHQTNVLVAKMSDDTVVIASSPRDTVGAEALIAWVFSELAPKKVIVINTHFHADGTGGNAAFKRHHIETWSSDLTRSLYLQNADASRIDEARSATPEMAKRILARAIVPADKIFKAREGLLLNFGGENVEVIFPGAAHTLDNMAVYLPSRRVLFGGCMVRSGNEIGPLKQADMDQWDLSVENLQNLHPAIVIPGHGPVGDAEYLSNTIRLVRSTRLKRLQ